MHKVYAYIAVMFLVTYGIRALPLTLLRRELKSPFLRSFLYYAPYVTLTAITFPAILGATGCLASAVIALAAASAAALMDLGLFAVALSASAAAYIAELFLL